MQICLVDFAHRSKRLYGFNSIQSTYSQTETDQLKHLLLINDVFEFRKVTQTMFSWYKTILRSSYIKLTESIIFCVAFLLERQCGSQHRDIAHNNNF